MASEGGIALVDLDEQGVDRAFRADVLEGLGHRQKAIPARWLYDDAGSQLFEDITQIPEYYPTRAEAEILTARGAEFAAAIGKGRYYFTESAEEIPKLFVDETREVAGESLKEEPAQARLNPRFRRERFLTGVRVGSAPDLGGYVPTQAKRKAQVIMTIADGDPLLVRWKQGKGWVYVFTSDIKNKWGRAWLRWSGFAPLWRQLIKDGIHEEKKERQFPIEVAAARHRLTVATDAIGEDDTFISGVTSKAVITSPDGKKQEVVLTQAAPGRYEAQLDAPLYGPYKVDVEHFDGDKKIAVSTGRATYPYPEEHLRFEPDLQRVVNLSETTGGRADPDPAALFAVDGKELTHRAPAWHWLLYFALAAIFLDVALRRVRLWPTRTSRLTVG